MAKYPIEVTWDDLMDAGITPVEDNEATNNRFLQYIHEVLYDYIIYANNKKWRKKIIEKYADELRDDIKSILINIAHSVNDSGSFNGSWDGVTRLDTGDYSTKSLQERMLAVVPPLVWQQVFSLEPNIMFAGGEI